MYTVYHAWCEPSQKSYVGQTIQGLARRKAVHFADSLRDNGRKFCRAIRKYGRDAFTWQELACVGTKTEADNLERLWIALLNTADRNVGYNQTTGGDGYEFTAEAKARVKANSPRGERHAYHGKPLPCAGVAAKNRTNKALTAPINKEIVRLYESGLGVIKIGKTVNMHKDTVYHRLKMLGVLIRSEAWTRKGD
jgi:group I intron endonuclease